VDHLLPQTLTDSLDPWTIGAIVFIGYWLLCRSLRWRLQSSIAKRFKGRDPYSLSVDEAQWVVQELFQLEMPHFSRFSTAFALFRTYGIPTISNLLLKYFPRIIFRFNLKDCSTAGCRKWSQEICRYWSSNLRLHHVSIRLRTTCTCHCSNELAAFPLQHQQRRQALHSLCVSYCSAALARKIRMATSYRT